MPLFDAIRLTLADDTLSEGEEREAKLFLTPVGQKIVIRLGTTDLSCLEKVFVQGDYELPFSLVAPRLIVDAGANIGMASLFFGSRFPEAQIIAIEPEKSNFNLLEQNCRNLPNITLMQAALWPEQCSLTISDCSAEKYAFRVTNQFPAGSNIKRIAGITIGDILQQSDAPRIDLLKLDIEGSELELFAKETANWLDRVEIIAVELHDRFRPGCAHALYSALAPKKFVQEIRGETIFIKISSPDEHQHFRSQPWVTN